MLVESLSERMTHSTQPGQRTTAKLNGESEEKQIFSSLSREWTRACGIPVTVVRTAARRALIEGLPARRPPQMIVSNPLSLIHKCRWKQRRIDHLSWSSEWDRVWTDKSRFCNDIADGRVTVR